MRLANVQSGETVTVIDLQPGRWQWPAALAIALVAPAALPVWGLVAVVQGLFSHTALEMPERMGATCAGLAIIVLWCVLIVWFAPGVWERKRVVVDRLEGILTLTSYRHFSSKDDWVIPVDSVQWVSVGQEEEGSVGWRVGIETEGGSITVHRSTDKREMRQLGWELAMATRIQTFGGRGGS